MTLQPATVQLSTPIQDFGKEVTAVTISRELTGADLLQCDGLGRYAETLAYIRILTGLSEAGCKALTARDISRIERAMAPFCGVGSQSDTSGGFGA